MLKFRIVLSTNPFKVFKTRNKNRKNKKEGFTLIELIAVIAIIAILATIMLPKVTGYVKEAKKTKVIDQCRKVVMAVESYDMRNSTPLDKTISIDDAKDNEGFNKYLEDIQLSNLDSSTTKIADCYKIASGTEFTFAENSEKLDAEKLNQKADQ